MTRSTRRSARPVRALAIALVCAVVAGALLVLPVPASAHTPHDDVSDVVVSPRYAQDGKVFVISGNRLQVSTDGPYHWKPLVRGLPRPPEDGKSLARIAISPSQPDTMYVTSFVGGLFRSTDGGESWHRAANGISAKELQPVAVSPRDPDVVLVAGTFGGFWRTADGGSTWQPLQGFPRVTALTFAPGTGRAFAGDGQGRVSVSDDQGATWKAVTTLPGGAVTAIGSSTDRPDPTVFAGNTKGVIARSTDGGSTFRRVGEGVPTEMVQSFAFTADFPRDHTVWVSTAEHGVFKSTDAGRTWKHSSRGLTGDIQAHVVKVTEYRMLAVGTKSDGSRVLYEGGFDGLFRSDDDGARWQHDQTLVDYVVGLGVSPEYAKDSSVAVATYVKGAYLSTDRGDRWTRIDDGLSAELAAGNKFAPVRRLHNITFSPTYGTDHTLFSATWDRFLKSTDGGKHWALIPVAPPPPGTSLRQFVLGVSPAYRTDHTLFLGTRQGNIYRSDRAGDAESWQEVGNVHTRVRSFAFDPGFPTRPVIFVGTEEGVRRSTDGGRTWTATGPTGETNLAISPDFARDGTVFAGTFQGLYVTRDGGETWSEIDAPPLARGSRVEALGVSPSYGQDHTVLVSVGGVGLFRSTDGGKTFTAVGRDLIEANRDVADYTNPTGRPIQFSPSYATDHTIFAYGGQDVMRSSDRGETWTVLHLPSADEFLRAVDPALLAEHQRAGHVTDVAGTSSTSNGSTDPLIVLGVAVVALVALGGGVGFYASRRRRSRNPVP